MKTWASAIFLFPQPVFVMQDSIFWLRFFYHSLVFFIVNQQKMLIFLFRDILPAKIAKE
jgi:hypothetical protein